MVGNWIFLKLADIVVFQGNISSKVEKMQIHLQAIRENIAYVTYYYFKSHYTNPNILMIYMW